MVHGNTLIKNMTDEQIIEVIRNHALLGRNTMSLVDMCMTDDELIEDCRDNNKKSIAYYISLCLDIEDIHQDRLTAYDIMTGRKK